MELEIDYLTSRILLQLQMSVLHESTFIFKAGLSSSYDCWVKYKKKYLIVRSQSNVETTCNSKLKFTFT